jgi:gamma-glutamyl:cysteine ligase YbdK (ATP-grasp superfamily)
MRDTSQMFHALAHELADRLPADPETTVALRKLLESKDCAVRASLGLVGDPAGREALDQRPAEPDVRPPL